MVLEEPDQATKSKTIYDVSPREIMWRNFLAGMSRAVGGMVIYFVLAFFLGQVFVTYIWPVLAPSIDTLGQTGEILEQLQMLQQDDPFSY